MQNEFKKNNNHYIDPYASVDEVREALISMRDDFSKNFNELHNEFVEIKNKQNDFNDIKNKNKKELTRDDLLHILNNYAEKD